LPIPCLPLRYRASYEASCRRVIQDRIDFESRLRSAPGITVYPSRANFVHVRAPTCVDGRALRNELLVEHGLLVRECGNNLGSDRRHFRFAARPRDHADLLIDALQTSFHRDRSRRGSSEICRLTTSEPSPAPGSIHVHLNSWL
jgi:histidinol-phosphate/aromatic aminotransferase/cobyric acid decarboxylase-like protein